MQRGVYIWDISLGRVLFWFVSFFGGVIYWIYYSVGFHLKISEQCLKSDLTPSCVSAMNSLKYQGVGFALFGLFAPFANTIFFANLTYLDSNKL